jgi:hypothetical protein
VYVYTGVGARKCEKFCEELIVYFPLIPNGPHRKRRLQHFFVAGGMSLQSCYIATTRGCIDRPTDTSVLTIFFIVACIRCNGNVFTGPLPSNEQWDNIQTHRLVGGIYEVLRWDGVRCRDLHTKFHKNWSRHSKVSGRGWIHNLADRLSLLEETRLIRS